MSRGILEFFYLSSLFFNLSIVLAAYLQKTGGFALQWSLARAIFTSVFKSFIDFLSDWALLHYFSFILSISYPKFLKREVFETEFPMYISRIDERTISLRFLGIILGVLRLRLEVSVYNLSYIYLGYFVCLCVIVCVCVSQLRNALLFF